MELFILASRKYIYDSYLYLYLVSCDHLLHQKDYQPSGKTLRILMFVPF